MGVLQNKALRKRLHKASSHFQSVDSNKLALDFLTGKSRHFGFIEFEELQIVKVVAECMHNYLLFEHLLQVHPIPPEEVHPKLWKGYNPRYKMVDTIQIERKNQKKVSRSGPWSSVNDPFISKGLS